MTRTAAPAPAATDVREDEARRRPVWKPLAAAGLGGAVLLGAGYGVFASLSATATSTPQTVTSGTLSLVMAPNGVGFTTAIDKLAPADVVNRFVTLTNNGDLASSANLAVSVAATGDAELLNAGVAGGPLGLRVKIDSCATAWVVTGTEGTCAAPVNVLPLSPLASITGSSATLLTAARAAGDASHLRVSVSLPEQTEVTANGVRPASTIQGKSAQLTWTFSETQRAATTTAS